MKLVFCGTPEFAVPTLEAVHAAGHQIVLVVTQPDRQSGRKMELHAPPVKEKALELGLPVIQPEKIKNNPEFQQQMEAAAPDAIVVVAYGRIIPRWMLDLPRFGNINLHASLLPKYRGAAHIQWAIANGESTTGATTMLIDEGLDTGGILLQRTMPIPEGATATDMFAALSQDGAWLMVDTLIALEAGTISPQPQDNAVATHARILTREDGLINFSRLAQDIYNRWRGFQPWPGAYTFFRGKKLIVNRMAVADVEPERIFPGTTFVEYGRLLVECGGGSAIELLTVQPEGGKPISPSEFLNGYQLKDGERLG